MVSPGNPRRSRALALLLGLGVAALIAEGGARWWHAHPSPPPKGDEAAPPGMFVASETMGVQLAPSFSYPAEKFATNSLGLRDRERDGTTTTRSPQTTTTRSPQTTTTPPQTTTTPRTEPRLGPSSPCRRSAGAVLCAKSARSGPQPLWYNAAMRWIAIVILVLGTVGCDEQVIGSSGLNLGDMFPKRADWFYHYDNDDYSEVSFWHNAGLSAPHDDDWITMRVFVDSFQGIIDDVSADDQTPDVDDGTNWAFKLYFLDNAGPVWFQGWEANPDHPDWASLGTVYYDSPGMPFALSDTIDGETLWMDEQYDTSWTATPSRNNGELTFNGNSFTNSWDIDITTDAGDHPFEGTWTILGGPGIIRFDVNAMRSDLDPGAPWEYNREAAWAEVLGS